MKYFLISDNADTLMGLRLAGIEGVRAQTREEALAAIAQVKDAPDIGILIITEVLADLCRDELDPLKLSGHAPLIVEIPDRNSTGRSSDSITRYIREAIGVKL